MAKSRDLFDDTTMSFGEHLEVLRVHVWRSLIGLVIGIAICLVYGDKVISIVRTPIARSVAETWDLPASQADPAAAATAGMASSNSIADMRGIAA